MNMTMWKMWGSQRFQVLLENAEHFEKDEIPGLLRKVIFTTSLPDTPPKHLEYLLELLQEVMPIAPCYGSYCSHEPYGLSSYNLVYNSPHAYNTAAATQKQLLDHEFGLEYIIQVFLGKNDAYHPKRIDLQSSNLVWRIMLELLERCHPKQRNFIDCYLELYQSAADYCQELIDETDDPDILSFCGSLLLCLLNADSNTRKINLEPLTDEKKEKIRRINNSFFQGDFFTLLYKSRTERNLLGQTTS